MTATSTKTLLFEWFRAHTPSVKKPQYTTLSSRTGYATAYPPIKRHHRRSLHLFSCALLSCKSKKKTSSIPGCASFARFDSYNEGENEEDC